VKKAREYTDEEWEALRETFRGIKRRVLPSPAHLPADDRLGPIERAYISEDPPGAAEVLVRTLESCPVCGTAVSLEERVAASVEPEFAANLSVMIGAWAHPACLANCEETADERGVPW
jgi:hypothetical protein